MSLKSAFSLAFGALVLASLMPGCSSDPLDAAEDVDDIPLSRKLNALKRGEAESLCAKRFVLFGGEGGSIQCEGEDRYNKLGTMESCVAELKATKCEYTVKDYRSCGEPKAGQGVCGFISPLNCVKFVTDCKLKAKSR